MDKPGKKFGYEDLFIVLSSIVEKWFIRTLLLLALLLLISQTLLQFPMIRYFLVQVEQLEGVPFSRFP
jgi:uncharacterized membrane protein